MPSCIFLSSLFFLHVVLPLFFFFFFNDTATTEIYTLSLHDALPIYLVQRHLAKSLGAGLFRRQRPALAHALFTQHRSEEHTSELQSHLNLVCRLLLEKKKKKHRKI